MNKLIITILAAGCIASLSSCGRAAGSDNPSDSGRAKRVALVGETSVYTVQVDGKEYVLAQSSYGVSITPKTP